MASETMSSNRYSINILKTNLTKFSYYFSKKNVRKHFTKVCQTLIKDQLIWD